MPARSGLIDHRSWGLDSPTIIDWRSRAVCRPGGGWDPDMWVVDGSSLSEENEKAQRLCGGCPVSTDCEAFAIRNRSVGVIMAGRWRHSRTDDGGTVQRRCEHCGKSFTATSRSVARYCPHCRVRVGREKRAALAEALVVERFAVLPTPVPQPTPEQTAAAQAKRRADLLAALEAEVA